ncbi:uncharacterized protein K444DRAFT_642186 [Hyaloscypha bicolor E]|uniref:Uncharacterized protein n=1 Tax=Hyaloscypha bicolor E TaxID=1095630 RepID=A0A2J6TFX9_9HELO|nr:uncharacterized protein K444DRAFT_642186 [Hyaloscypha bicolor E]PMD61924.1 hypothetical protein K444DRAFT_642186 [Hyaloscypha bicolor E]
MDGLSAAASGIAVVSLAIQLVDSVREIRRFLRDVSEAPKELRRLIDLLEQLELILENIGALVERQQEHTAQAEIDVSGSILRAMRTCESKLQMLEGVVEAAKKSATATNKTTRTFGSFRLACKRREIEEFESQLRDAINLLNLAMTTNLTIGHVLELVTATNQMTTTISRELLHSRNDSGTDADHGVSATAEVSIQSKKRKAGFKLSKRQSYAFSSYSGLFGKLYIRRKISDSTFGDEEEPSPMTAYANETTWTFMPSFLSYAFDFRYLNTCGHIERSLRTYPVLPLNHPVWEMCECGDLKGIQKLLSNQQISPSCVNSYGTTLLHRSASYNRAEICQFLIEVGLTAQETNRGPVWTTHPRIPNKNRLKAAKDVEKTYDIISCHMRNLDSTDFSAGLFTSTFVEIPVDLFTRIVHEWLTEENINDCSLPFQCPQWKSIIFHLIRLGSNLQRGSKKGITILDDLMNRADTPFESKSFGLAWLDILTELRLDVVEYLRTEYCFYFDPSKSLPMLEGNWSTDFRARRLVVSEETPSISWDWFIDANGKTFEVLEEFKNFGPSYHNVIYWYPTRPELFSNWPFLYPKWAFDMEEAKVRSWDKKLAGLVQLAEDRFERRWHKKATKLARAQGLL